MRRIVSTLILLSITFLSAAFSNHLPLPVAATVEPVVRVWSNSCHSSNITIPRCGTLVPASHFTVQIIVTNAPTFNAYEFALYYDPHFITALSTDINTGTVFGDKAFAFKNSISTPGLVLMTVTGLGPAAPFSGGSGTLASIVFNITSIGVSPITLAAGTSQPSGSSTGPTGQTPYWTRLVNTVLSGSIGITYPIDVVTMDGYFKNEPTRLGPVAKFTFSPSNPTTGSTVAFDATQSFDADNRNNGIAVYKWDFGDRYLTDSSYPITYHTFGDKIVGFFSGNFSVRLTVVDRDDGFQGMIIHLVTISEPPQLCPLGAPSAQVPKDCPTIQSAIDSVVPEGTIQVSPGNFSEPLTVRKPLTLIGAGGNLTTVIGGISIQAPHVTISQFRILNNESSSPGIQLLEAHRSTISNNLIVGQGRQEFQFLQGIEVDDSSNVSLIGNTVVNENSGIFLKSSPNSILRANIMKNNTFNFGVGGDYLQDIDQSNTVNGRRIFYQIGAIASQIPPNPGYIGIVSSRDLAIGSVSVSNVGEGILIANSTHITVTGLNTKSVTVGASIIDSTSIVVTKSIIGDQKSIFGVCATGIRLDHSTSSTIVNNTLSCITDVSVENSSRNVIDENIMSAPTSIYGPQEYGPAIYVSNSSMNQFVQNHILKYQTSSIFLIESPSNIFIGNIVKADAPRTTEFFGNAAAIDLENSPNNKFRDNHIREAFAGIRVTSFHFTGHCFGSCLRQLADYVQDIDSSNTIDGKPIYYIVNKHDLTIPSGAGFIAIVNSNNINIRNVNLSYNSEDVLVVASKNIAIENSALTLAGFAISAWETTGLIIKHTRISMTEGASVLIEDSNGGSIVGNTIDAAGAILPFHAGGEGIRLSNSTAFHVEGNSISNYLYAGVALVQSPRNSICRNTIFQGPASPLPGFPSYGIGLDYYSTSNTVVGNTIAGNSIGLRTDVGNTIYYNNFVNNARQIIETDKPNKWDDGAGHGNYWSDYKGQDLDRDGVGDTLLPHLGVDSFPLMTPWAPAGLSATFTGKGAWAAHDHVGTSDESGGNVQTLFARAKNDGAASVWVEAVFNITSNTGAKLQLTSGPYWLEKGKTVNLSVSLQPTIGTYNVTAQLKYSSDAYLHWTDVGTKNFSFSVDSFV